MFRRTFLAAAPAVLGLAPLTARSEQLPSTNYTALPADQATVVSMDATAGPLTFKLPNTSTISAGYSVSARKSDASGNFVTVEPFASEAINGAPSYTLTLPNQVVTLYWDGAEWIVTQEAGTVVTGFNANGHFAKYADGTLEVWGTDYIANQASSKACTCNWTPPHPFSSEPQNLAANIQNNGISGISRETISEVTVDVSYFPIIYVRVYKIDGMSGWPSNAYISLNIRAVGRWFEA